MSRTDAAAREAQGDPLCAEVTIARWQDARELFGDPQFQDWIFRGQPVTAALETTFERATWDRDGIRMPREAYFQHEKQVMREFQRRAHQFIPEFPRHVAELEWLALIQHHGGPTRLLDFTHSFYVAAFFALERTRGAASIWAMDRRTLNANASAQYRMRVEPELSADFHFDRDDGYRFGRAVREEVTEPIAVSLEPVQMNMRLAAQQGLFVAPFALGHPFEENLAGSFGRPAADLAVRPKMIFPEFPWPSTPVVMIIIPVRAHLDALKDLQRMNVTAATLFPGLDGLARSMAFYLLD
ncbi:MAG: FRG domain-containing protein [Chloroflexi bacterium]|nr:FRG domain-containing protein [Chloroflexota bacterium]